MAVESAREKERRKIRYSSAKETAEKQQRGFEPASLKVPKGFSLFRFREEKVYKLDVIPFLAGKGNPMAEPGIVHFERTYYTHSGIGTEPRAHYTCPSKASNNKLPCPVCEHVNKLQMEGVDDKVIQTFRPKKRQLWCFIDTKDRDKGIQIFEGPYFRGLGEAVDAKIDATDEDSPKRDFFHLDKGLTLYVSIKKEGFKNEGSAGTFMAISNIEMEPRSRQYDNDMLEKAPCLDDIIKVLSYDDLHEIFHQSGTKSKTEPERNGKPKPSDEETDETAADLGIKEGSKVRTKKLGICEVLHISGDGTSLKLEDEEGEVHSGIAPSSCTLIDDEDDEPGDEEDDDEEERPKAKAKPPKVKVRPKEDKDDKDDEDEPEEDDDDESDSDDEDEDEPEDEDFDDDSDDEDEDEDEPEDEPEDEDFDDDSDDDDEDEEDDDEPKPKPKKSKDKPPKKQPKPKKRK